MSTLADDINAATETTTPGATIDVTSTEARVQGFITDKPIERAEDWAPVFRRFNLDPDAFEVVDDTVRMSSWDQSSRAKSGHRDFAILYSYAATFRRVTGYRIRDAVVDGWRDALRVRTRPVRPPAISLDAGTYKMLVADPQIGKKGTDEALANWRRGVTAHIEAARKLGPAVERVHVGFMGDEFEGVANNYPNQAHTVEMNFSRQMETAYDHMVWTIREALSLRKRTTASAVISNHPEWTRNGSKDPVTTQHDNGSTYLARQVAKLFDELAPYTRQTVEWTIGDDHPGVVLDLSGAKTYLSHGYIEKGRGPSVEVRTRQALERQILGRTEDLGDVDIFDMAHYHHFYANTFEGRTLFGCPAIEAEKSSEYMLDQFGVWSRPGVLGMLVGANVGADKWSHVNVF